MAFALLVGIPAISGARNGRVLIVHHRGGRAWTHWFAGLKQGLSEHLGHLGQKSLSYVERVREEIPNA
jgi:hypothetical protein